METPLVVLLDLDGTLVGKVGPILCEYELGRWLSAAGLGNGESSSSKANNNANSATTRRTRAGPNGGVSKALRDSLVRRMRYGIIRPHVHEFCRSLPKGVELFVYTASEDSWANFIVPCVEAALGVRFNRPIFSRSHCVSSRGGGGGGNNNGAPQLSDLRKTVAGLYPAIARALGGSRGGVRRYPGLRSAADLRDRVVLVDNTPGVLADPREQGRAIVCPTYSYHYGYDVLGRVPVDVLHTRFRNLVPALERAGLFPLGEVRAVDSYQRFASVYYRRLAKVVEATLASNAAALAGDTFFLRLLHAINALVRRGSLFTDAAVAGLQHHPR